MGYYPQYLAEAKNSHTLHVAVWKQKLGPFFENNGVNSIRYVKSFLKIFVSN
jgi:hypothetical protein